MAARHRGLTSGAALAAAALLTGCNALLGPSGVDHNWRTYDSAHFQLYVRPGSFAEGQAPRLAEALEDQYAVTLATLDIVYAGRIKAFLYSSAADADLDSNYSGVAYSATESLRAVVVPPFGGNLVGLLAHEANHVIQQNALGRPGTFFMNEGLPSAVLSSRFNEFGTPFLWAWTASHAASIPPITDLSDDEKWDGGNVAYKASASFLAYLIQRSGPSPIRQLYQVPSSLFAARVRELYGVTLEDLERDWRAFCATRAAGG